MNPQQLKQQITQLTQQKKFDKAKQLAHQLVTLNQKDIEAWFALAQLQERLGEFESAVRSLYQVCQGPSPLYIHALEKAVEISRQHKLYNLGLPPAIKLAELKPDASRYFCVGDFYFDAFQNLAAIPYLQKAVELDKTNKKYSFLLARSLINVGKIEEGIAILGRISLKDGDENALVMSAMASNYAANFDDDHVFKCHRRFGEQLSKNAGAAEGVKPQFGEKIRVGYISPDFKAHSVAYFFQALVDGHSRDRFEVYCYSDNPKSDKFTARIKQSSDVWRDISGQTVQSAIKQIKNDSIDILVDLVGLSGHSRAPVFAGKPAPVQVTYLGYPNTTGLSEMDYRITDAWSDPIGMTESQYTEELVRLESGFLCYSELDDVPEVSDLPADSNNGAITFCSFNAFNKISVQMVEVWAKILKAVPGANLFIKTKPLAEEALQELVWKQFEQSEIPRERVRLQGWAQNVESHLELYNQVDIHLDTYPYNGTTTTIESLRQGVPVVTLAGKNHRSRVSGSILSQIGQESLVANTEEEYIDIAVNLASDLEQLRALRKSLRQKVDESSLMDREGFIREFEDAFEYMLKEAMNK